MPATAWIGLATHLGSAAVGLDADIGDCYVFANGGYPDGTPRHALDWQRTDVPRSSGWHVFELIWEAGELWVVIDGEPISMAPTESWEEDAASPPARVWVCAKRGDPGYWAALEVFHTPSGQSSWAAGVQHLRPGVRRPWQRARDERGVWQIWRSGGRCVVTGEADPPVEEVPSEEEQAETPEEAMDPEEAEELEEVADEELDASPEASPSHADGALTIECWSLPEPSTDLVQIQRVMEFFIDRLQQDGVILPNNIRRVGECREASHATCYVYRFGTRRLHVKTREVEGGRLCLVVRCGGGFFDFADFARRHGSLEQLKMQRMSEPQGRQVVQLTSVLSRRQRQLRQSGSGGLSPGSPGSRRGSTPGSRRGSPTARQSNSARSRNS